MKKLLVALAILLVAATVWGVSRHLRLREFRENPCAAEGCEVRMDGRYISVSNDQRLFCMSFSGRKLDRLWLVLSAWEGTDNDRKPYGEVYAFKVGYADHGVSMPDEFRICSAVLEQRVTRETNGGAALVEVLVNGRSVFKYQGAIRNVGGMSHSSVMLVPSVEAGVIEDIVHGTCDISGKEKKMVAYELYVVSEEKLESFKEPGQRLYKFYN